MGSGDRQLVLHWPGLDARVRANLLGANRDLEGRLVALLPFTSVQSHAVVAGQQIYFPTRLPTVDPAALVGERLDKQPPGRLNFEPAFQYLAVAYGPMSEPVPAFPVAQVVPDDLEVLARIGERVWDNLLYDDEALCVVVASPGAEVGGRRHAGCATHAPRPAPEGIDVATAAGFLKSETDAVWLDEPEDVQALREGRLDTGAGVGGQYFTPWVMVSGLVRSLAVVELPALAAELEEHPEGWECGRRQLSRLLRVPLGVMGYFGLSRLQECLELADRALHEVADARELHVLIGRLTTLANRYQLWLHQTFPWRLATQFPVTETEGGRT